MSQSTPLVQQQLKNALQLAHTHFKHGNLPQASMVCSQIMQILPAQPDAWHLRGIIELQQGNIEVAINNIQRALAAQPGHPEYTGNLGFAFHEKGDLVKAEDYYAKALKVAPGYANVLYNQHALLLSTDPVGAIKNLEQLIRIHPHDNDAHYMLGVVFECENKPDLAAAHLDMLKHGSPLDRARLDAWEYIKSTCPELPPITGSMIETFRLAMAAPLESGLVLEFGVRFGNTIRQIATLANQQVYGFDSFEGLPEVWHHEPKGSYTTRGEIPKVPANVELIAGWFDETLPIFLKNHPGPARFLNIDCDIYSSTKTVLNLLAPRIVSGTVIVFDEYIGNEHWREDEHKAFQEAVAKYKWDYEYLCFSAFTKQVAVRIK
jgi:Tfp pilus assembly protein PilF